MHLAWRDRILLWRGGKNKRQCIDGRHFLRVHLPSSEYPSSVLEYAQTAVVYGVHKVFVVVTSARVERQIRAIVFCGMERGQCGARLEAGCSYLQRRGLACDTGRAVSLSYRCRASSMVVGTFAEAERPRENAAAAPALLPRIGCRQRRSDQRRREWRSGQRPMQRPLRRVHLLAVCQPAVPNLSGGGRGTKPPGRCKPSNHLFAPASTLGKPARERSIDRGSS